MPAPTAWGRSVGGNAAQRVATARARLRQTRNDRDQAVAEARAAIRTRIIDGVLCLDDGTQSMTTERDVEQRRSLAEKRTRDQYAAQLDELLEELRQDSELLSRVAAETRPGLADDALAQQRAVMAWEQSIKPRLEAGALPSEILATADLTTALAMAEWGPSWLQARDYAARPTGMDGLGWEPGDTSHLTRAVDARLSELDDDYSTYRTAMVEAEKAVAYSQPIIDADVGRAGEPGLVAAVAAHFGAQDVAQAHAIAAADGGGDVGGDD